MDSYVLKLKLFERKSILINEAFLYIRVFIITLSKKPFENDSLIEIETS
jgi:hypothetical protein